MLVLSRKLNEKVVIGGDIVVTVVRIDRNTVRLGIEAPGDVRVLRAEIAPQVLEFTLDTPPIVAEACVGV